MAYRNTIKLFVSNFALVWKQLLYLLVSLAIFAFFAWLTASPIISLLRENEIGLELSEVFHSVYNSPSEFALMLSECFKHIISVIFSNFSTIWPAFIGLIIFCIFLPYVMIEMSFYNITSILYQKITMNMNAKYIQNAMQTFKNSVKYAFANILFNLPFLIITIFAIAIYMLLAVSVLSSIVLLIVLSAILLFLNALKNTLFSCYVSYMVVNNAGPFVSLKKGIALVFKNFWKNLSTSIVILLTIIFVNGIITIFTFFAGLIVLIPASFVFLSIYYLVVYLNTTGERYYLGANLIYNPSKYVIKQEDYTQASIPEITSKPKTTATKPKKRKKNQEKNDN